MNNGQEWVRDDGVLAGDDGRKIKGAINCVFAAHRRMNGENALCISYVIYSEQQKVTADDEYLGTADWRVETVVNNGYKKTEYSFLWKGSYVLA